MKSHHLMYQLWSTAVFTEDSQRTTKELVIAMMVIGVIGITNVEFYHLRTGHFYQNHQKTNRRMKMSNEDKDAKYYGQGGMGEAYSNMRKMNTAEACCCIGRQNNEPFCPCEMRMREIFKRGDEWIEPEKVVGKVMSSDFNEVLKNVISKYGLSTKE